jgi:hypothetical protein
LCSAEELGNRPMSPMLLNRKPKPDGAFMPQRSWQTVGRDLSFVDRLFVDIA